MDACVLGVGSEGHCCSPAPPLPLHPPHSPSLQIRQLTLELEALRLSHTSQLSAIQSEYSSAARSLHSHESLARAREEEVRGLSLRVAELEAELAGLVLKREACEEQLQEERQAAGALQEELGVKEAELAAQEAQLRQTQEGVRQLEKRLTSYESDHRDVLSLVGQLRGPKQKVGGLGPTVHEAVVIQWTALVLCAVDGPGQPHPQRGAQGGGERSRDCHMTLAL